LHARIPSHPRTRTRCAQKETTNESPHAVVPPLGSLVDDADGALAQEARGALEVHARPTRNIDALRRYPWAMRNSLLALAVSLVVVLLASACRSTQPAPTTSAAEPAVLPEIRYYEIADT
jgi:hypothetical protein